MKDTDYAPIGPNSATGAADQHFDTVLYEGNEKVQRIGGLNFQPDLIWTVHRDSTGNWNTVYDSLRGPNSILVTHEADAENIGSDPQGFLSFNPDGFTINTPTRMNTSGGDYVSWCWKAGNGSVIDDTGTISVTRSTNVDAGFSIVSYTGAGSAATLGHGLSYAPEMMIVKRVDAGTGGWYVYHEGMDASAPEDKYLQLQDAGSVADATWPWNDTAPTSSVFSIGSDANISGSNNTFIAYCWHSVEGFSKFGSYEGNANADGPFVYLGFKPALVICKDIDATGHWEIYDNKRNPHNPVTKTNWADLHTSVEQTSGRDIDFLSNGFKCRHATIPNSATTHIYMAWAEMPFKYATAR